MTTLGRRIADARWDARLNKSQLARRVGITWNTLHRLENGEHHDTWWSTMVRIARETGKPLTYFLEDYPEELDVSLDALAGRGER